MTKREKIALTVGAIVWVCLLSYFFNEMLK